MKKLGLIFWLCVGVASIAICWWLLTGQFPFSGSWDEIAKFIFVILTYSFAITAYERTQANTKAINELVSEIETLKCEIEELQDSLPANYFKLREEL